MVNKLPPNKDLFNTGITVIRKHPKETQEQFDSTKDEATFSFQGETHILKLDGRVDDVVLDQIGGASDYRITELEQLRGKSEAIIKACKASEDIFGDLRESEIDLGTSKPWMAFPEFNNQSEVIGHTLIPVNSGRSHTISVDQSEAGLELTVNTETNNNKNGLGHSMTGLFTADGQIIALREGMSYPGE